MVTAICWHYPAVFICWHYPAAYAWSRGKESSIQFQTTSEISFIGFQLSYPYKKVSWFILWWNLMNHGRSWFIVLNYVILWWTEVYCDNYHSKTWELSQCFETSKHHGNYHVYYHDVMEYIMICIMVYSMMILVVFRVVNITVITVILKTVMFIIINSMIKIFIVIFHVVQNAKSWNSLYL